MLAKQQGIILAPNGSHALRTQKGYWEINKGYWPKSGHCYPTFQWINLWFVNPFITTYMFPLLYLKKCIFYIQYGHQPNTCKVNLIKLPVSVCMANNGSHSGNSLTEGTQFRREL